MLMGGMMEATQSVIHIEEVSAFHVTSITSHKPSSSDAKVHFIFIWSR